jgi:ligand-binding sensor domain-containing protein
MVGGKTLTFILAAMALFGRVTEWEHFPHYGGGNWIISSGDLLIAATSGGLLFAHYSEAEDRLVADSGWTSPGVLSHSRVTHVTEASDGSLWVSMYGGGIDVFHPDGQRTTYNQIDGLPLNLGINQTIPDTVVYAATTQGLCIREVGYFETWDTYSTGGGLPSDNITFIMSADSGLYVGTSAGLVFLPESASPSSQSSWMPQSVVQGSVTALEFTGDTLWAATSSRLYRKPPQENWQEVNGFPGASIASLAAGPDGLAVGSTNAVYVYEGGQWSTYDKNLNGDAVTGMVWHKGRLCGVLANTYSISRASGSGLCLLLGDGNWRRTFPQFGPVSNDLRDVALHTDGSVWVSSNRNGGSVFSNGTWTNLNPLLTSLSQCFSVSSADEGVFFSSLGSGVDWLPWDGQSAGSAVHFSQQNGMLNNRVYDSAQGAQGVIWFAHRSLLEGEPSGVGRLSWSPGDPVSASFIGISGAQGLPSKDVNAVLPLGSRYAWAATDGGLALVDGSQMTMVETYGTQHGLPSSIVTALAIDRSGTLFAGTASGMVSVASGTVNTVDGIEGAVSALAADHMGSIWVASASGLKRYFPASGVLEEYTPFNSPFPGGTISAMEVDPDRGHLWMATEHGLWKGVLESGLFHDDPQAMIYPNPFIPMDHGVMGLSGIPDVPVLLRIFDLTGTLVYEYSSPDRDSAAWNGVTDSGVPAASGVYIAAVSPQGLDTFMIKFTLVR